MDRAKRQRLERKGWKVGRVDEFLALAPEEAACIELKLGLSESIKERRQRKRLKSSQSRVAKIEAADVSVSLDLLVRALIVLGATRREVAQAIAHGP